jgi:hypothetical protein
MVEILRFGPPLAKSPVPHSNFMVVIARDGIQDLKISDQIRMERI